MELQEMKLQLRLIGHQLEWIRMSPDSFFAPADLSLFEKSEEQLKHIEQSIPFEEENPVWKKSNISKMIQSKE